MPLAACTYPHPGSPAESLPKALGAYMHAVPPGGVPTSGCCRLYDRAGKPNAKRPQDTLKKGQAWLRLGAGPLGNGCRCSCSSGGTRPWSPAAHTARSSNRVAQEPWHQAHTRPWGVGPPPEASGTPVHCHTACYTVVALSYIMNACPFSVDPAGPSAQSPLWPWASALPERTPAAATQGLPPGR